ncbi:hypothetical protein EB796_005212 [Bugula neritina]|uniref:Ion transport domain-containing protein n=1 Tax=Bugula neritina TaxID=10212 RepID=A0A7J7KCV8_BUGNE|nr:hypothetical protein EB796_005212 [Bugula neritina]
MTELRPFTGLVADMNTTCKICCISTTSAHVGCFEIFTYIMAFSMLLEEIRQVLFRDNRPIKYIRQKVEDWIRDSWNKIDITSYVLFTTAIVLRFTISTSLFWLVRGLFCFSFMIYFIRFSQILFVFEQLGPKIIMIKKMMVDLIFFLVILLMTILAFGVICQAILNPEASLTWNIIKDVIYWPYFQMYGELFLEDGFQEG